MDTGFTVPVLSPEGSAKIPNEVHSERIQNAGINGVRGLIRSEGKTMKWSVQVNGGGETDVSASKVERIKHFPGRGRRRHAVMNWTPPTGILGINQVVGGCRIEALSR